MVADTLLPLIPSIGTQPKHVVVRKARATKRASKDDFLFGSWVKPKSVRALNVHVLHNNTIPCEHQTLEKQPCGCAPFTPRPEGRGFSEQIWSRFDRERFVNLDQPGGIHGVHH